MKSGYGLPPESLHRFRCECACGKATRDACNLLMRLFDRVGRDGYWDIRITVTIGTVHSNIIWILCDP
ncbi:MAG: hypothetical protein L6V93_03080 [Clostridiales bacterium]|nr:MAG: hypothetical protein L6V93_03080 [Clostridiales bacterium]